MEFLKTEDVAALRENPLLPLLLGVLFVVDASAAKDQIYRSYAALMEIKSLLWVRSLDMYQRM